MNQFDADPDEDLNDLEENLHTLVEDSSSSDNDDDGSVAKAAVIPANSASASGILDDANDDEVFLTGNGVAKVGSVAAVIHATSSTSSASLNGKRRLGSRSVSLESGGSGAKEVVIPAIPPHRSFSTSSDAVS